MVATIKRKTHGAHKAATDDHEEEHEEVVEEQQEAAASPPKRPPLAKVQQILMRLTNGCSTYVTPQKEVFHAKNVEGKIRVYPIDLRDKDRLLSYRDDYGRKFFREVRINDPTAVEMMHKPGDLKDVKETQVRPKAAVEDVNSSDPEVIDQASIRADDSGELDTGAMRLEDDDGKPVGVTV